MGSGPIWRAESSCSLRLSIGLLVLALQGKMFKNSASKFPLQTSSPPPVPFSTTIRIAWKGISAPFKHAEFYGSLCLSIALLVVEIQGKTYLILQFQNPAITIFTTLWQATTTIRKFLRGTPYTYLMGRIQQRLLFDLVTIYSGAIRENVSKFR
jgi:hypothetical protein